MTQLRQKYGLLAIGIALGIAYGLFTRYVFGETATLASITYLFVTPTLLGMVPLVFADPAHLKSYRNIIFIPWLTVATCFLTMYLIGYEESICILILGWPFFMLGTIGGFIYRLVKINRQKNKGKILTLLLVPFLLSPVEELMESPSQVFYVESEIVISAASDRIWENVVEVKTIEETEYTPGIFNRLGIPRPLTATVDEKGVGGQRTGNFEGGLRFVERITRYEPEKLVSFDIQVDPRTIGPRVFDQHVLNGNYFTFVNATYELRALADGQVSLKLTSSYQLTSKINLYGEFWGDLILRDFQDRLLLVIKSRCELSEPRKD